MDQNEMQQTAGKKVQQVLDLMKLLHLTVQAKQKVNMRTGFIELTVMWEDNEDYPLPEEPVAALSQSPVEDLKDLPTGEVTTSAPVVGVDPAVAGGDTTVEHAV